METFCLIEQREGYDANILGSTSEGRDGIKISGGNWFKICVARKEVTAGRDEKDRLEVSGGESFERYVLKEGDINNYDGKKVKKQRYYLDCEHAHDVNCGYDADDEADNDFN
jgi:hypothetical protein